MTQPPFLVCSCVIVAGHQGDRVTSRKLPEWDLDISITPFCLWTLSLSSLEC